MGAAASAPEAPCDADPMTLLRERPAFARLFAGGTISLVGDWFGFVAIQVLALSSGGGPVDLAIVLAAHTLPIAFGSVFSGAIVDRFDRRKVLVAADAIATALTVGMTIAASARQLHALEGLLVLRGIVTSIVPPAEAAAVRRFVGERDLVRANTLLASSWSLTYVVGMALGGVAASLGAVVALAIDALSFAVATALHASLPPIPIESTEPDVSLARAIRRAPRDTALALAIASRRPRLFAALLAKAPLALASGAAWVAMSAVAESHESSVVVPLVLGALQSVRGAGTVLGPATLLRGDGPHHAAVFVSRAGTYASVAAIGLVDARLGLALVALAWGIGAGTNWVASHAELLRRAPDAALGRLAAFDELLVAVATVLGTFVGALVVVTHGERPAALAAATIGLGAWAVVRWATGWSVRHAKERERVPNRLAPAEGSPYLRPLPSEDSCPAKSLPV